MGDLGNAETLADNVRSLPLACVLQRGGKLFEDSAGDDATFALSSSVNHVDAFISHTWSTPRWRKFMALSMHFNFTRALCISLFLGVVVNVLVTLEVLPVFYRRQGGWHEQHAQAPYAVVTVCISFHILLHFVHEVFPADSTRVFLDKACINQTDEERKKQGIANLGVTCFFSWSLVVLDSDEYFERLWTVYELSIFLLRPCSQILFLPVKLPLAVCMMSMTTMAGLLFSVMNETFDVPGIKDIPDISGVRASTAVVLLASWSPLIMLLAIVQRMWAREQDRRLRRVKCFSFAAARCSSEDDRPVVGGNVARMLVQTCNISEFDSRTRALECFDAVVRMLLPQAMQDRDVRPVFLP